MNTVTQPATKPNLGKPKRTYHYCKKPELEIKAIRWGEKKSKPKASKTLLATKAVVKQTLIWTELAPEVATKTIHTTETTENRELSTYPLCKTCGKLNYSTTKCCYFGSKAANRLVPRKKNINKTTSESTAAPTKLCKWKCPGCGHFKLKISNLHSRTALDRPETTKATVFPPIIQVDWQQPLRDICRQPQVRYK